MENGRACLGHYKQPMSNRELPRALLLNPPHRFRVVRDCYCSDFTKADYYWHPMDLLVQSALLQKHAELFLIDAIASKIQHNSALHYIKEIAPQYILCLIGDVIATDDLDFCRKLRRELPHSVLIGSGDVFLDDPVSTLKTFDVLNAALLDFTSTELARYVQGHQPEKDMIIKRNGSILRLPSSSAQIFSYPCPPTDLFDETKYHLPFFGGGSFHSTLTSYGCPFFCRFCPVPALGYKSRPTDEVITEIKTFAKKGIRNFYIRDATFGINREDALALCKQIATLGFRIRWNCFTRAELLDDEMLDAMAQAGCAVVQLGVETLDQTACASVNKPLELGNLHRLIDSCRRRRIMTSLHFIVGLPNDHWVSSKNAARDILKLNPDYISLNTYKPRLGSVMKREGIELSLVSLKQYRTVARRLNVRFYLRPKRILTELFRYPSNILRTVNLLRAILFPSRETSHPRKLIG